MTKITKIVKATCDNCGQTIQEGDQFTNVTIETKRNEIGFREDMEMPDSVGYDGAASEVGFDLCSKCYKSFEKMVKGFSSHENDDETTTAGTIK